MVAASLADLKGPAEGTVELPLWLFWSPDRTFDLSQPFMLRSMYEAVLGEASRPEDLATYLDGDTLIALWPDLFLPKGIRQHGRTGTRSWGLRPSRRPDTGDRTPPRGGRHRLARRCPAWVRARRGNALMAHGVIDRFTADVDLFTDREAGVAAAADAVEAALHDAGFEADRQDKASGLADIFEGMGEGLAEWIITAPAGEQMMLQMAYFDRSRGPVSMDVGPVLDLEDVIGGKVCALASRAYDRDYVDTAAALERYSVDQVIGFARRLDPGLEDRDFSDAGRRLDRMDDGAFVRFGLSPRDIAKLRARFAPWPRV